MLWQESYAVGIAAIDEQHQELFTRLEQLMDAAVNNLSMDTMEEMVAFLDQYTIDHFNGEEIRMAESHYPGLEEHKAMHREFIQELSSFKRELLTPSGNRPPITNLIGFLSDWLIQHILDMDQKMGHFLVDHGIK